MSRELHDIRRKVAMAQKRHAAAEQSKSRERQEKIIGSVSAQKQKYEDSKIRAVAADRRMDVLLSTFKFGAAVCFCIFAIFISSKAFSAPRSDFSVTIKGDEKYSRIAADKSEKVFKAFRNRDLEEIKSLAGRLDGMGREDCEEVFSRYEGFPDFKLAAVESPKTDPDLYYVYVPAPGRQRLQFVMRRINNALFFEGICMDE